MLQRLTGRLCLRDPARGRLRKPASSREGEERLHRTAPAAAESGRPDPRRPRTLACGLCSGGTRPHPAPAWVPSQPHELPSEPGQAPALPPPPSGQTGRPGPRRARDGGAAAAQLRASAGGLRSTAPGRRRCSGSPSSPCPPGRCCRTPSPLWAPLPLLSGRLSAQLPLQQVTTP